MTDTLHGDCRVYSRTGILIRIDRMVDRVVKHPLEAQNKLIGIATCPDCGVKFEKYHGNCKRCEHCAEIRAVIVQRKWKEKHRAAIRKRSH